MEKRLPKGCFGESVSSLPPSGFQMFKEQTYPRDPPVLNILRGVNFGTGSEFGTDVAKHHGECSEVLVF